MTPAILHKQIDLRVAPTADGHLANKKYADAGLALKANIASPTFTGTPKAPTATAGTNTTQVATTAFVQTAISIAGAGEDGDHEALWAALNALAATVPKMTVRSITGDGSTQMFAVAHNLGTRNVIAKIYDSSGAEVVFKQIIQSANAVSLYALTAPAEGETFSVVVIGSPN